MNIKVRDKAFVLMLNEEQIQKRIAALGEQLKKDYQGKNPVFIGVLSGSFMFLADLMKVTDLPAEISFVKVRSYEGVQNSGKINLELGLNIDVRNKDIIIVEDIVDSGHTLKYLMDLIAKENPKSIKVCSLLYKPLAVQYHFENLDYLGFQIANEFVVGYGLDYNSWGRNLRDIYQLAAN